MKPVIEIRRYVTATGKDVLGEWMEQLRDARARAKINARIARLAVGNFGDCRLLREGVSELRVNYGPGYRIYYSTIGRTLVLLLCGGTKRRQSADVDRAIQLLNDYRKRLR